MNRHIYNFFIPLISGLMLSSCGLLYDKPSWEELSEGKEDAILVLRISKLPEPYTNAEETPSNISVKEEIKSLRIIMIDCDNNIELNELIEESQLSSFNLNGIYTFQRYVTSGDKKFYLFANEEQVIYNNSNSLQNLINDFSHPGQDAVGLETSLQEIFFQTNYIVTEGTVLLPYSAYYEMNLVGGKECDVPMYIVPVATKFNICFHNMRTEETTIEQVSLISIADQNYLMAHVGVSDYYKDGKYWIDWLAEVSQESHNYQDFDDNQDFNDSYGWISDYSLPLTVTQQPDIYILENSITIDPLTTEAGNEPIPGEFYVPTFYRGESKVMSPDPRVPDEQTYVLQIKVWDAKNQQYLMLSRTLPNVKSLFRNTHLVINVDLNEGYMYVFGEIIGWSQDPVAKGYLREEEEL